MMAEAPGQTWRSPHHTRRGTILIVLVSIALVLVVLAVWRLPPFGGGTEATDNAYVRGRSVVISPQVLGYVVEVSITDYQDVKTGQILARIDDRVYAARVDQARANLAAAAAALENSKQSLAARNAGLKGQSAGIASAKAQLLRAQADMRRAEDLASDGSISIRERDQTIAVLRAAEAAQRQSEAGEEIARQDIRTVEVGRGGLEAQVEAARALLRAAEVDLSNTVIRAPEDGQLGEVGVRLGQYVANGTQLVTLVPPARWVIANYKESQTTDMAEGQPARFTVDAISGQVFSGWVSRISPATGSEFAVLKPDNATGNFVKVPQRIGVRIELDPKQAGAERLRPGMSVEVKIDTRAKK